jgi:cupin domain
VVVPLHKHADPELLYVLEGLLQVYRSNEGASGWTEAVLGDAIIIPGNVKHALRNSSSVPVTLALVTKSEVYSFFQELARPFDPHQPRATATPEAMPQLFEVAAKYGYLLASPAESAAIGLSIV